MIRKQQIHAARALLRWSRAELSGKAEVSERTIARFETGESDITASKLERLEVALEAEGIEFIDGGVVLERLKRRRGNAF